jgi:hypothetical protein
VKPFSKTYAHLAMRGVVAVEKLTKGLNKMKLNEETSCLGTWLLTLTKTQSSGQLELQEVMKGLDPWGIACADQASRLDVLTPIFVAAIRSVYRYVCVFLVRWFV